MRHSLIVCLATHTMAAVPLSAAYLFRATISPVTEAQHGQWNVALTGLAPGGVLAIWEAWHTEVKTPNVIMAAVSEDGGRSWSERHEFFRWEGMRCTPCGFYRSPASSRRRQHQSPLNSASRSKRHPQKHQPAQ